MDLAATVQGPTLTRDYSELESAAIQQINELKTLADRFSKGYSSFQRLRHRGRFLFEKRELTTRRAKADIAVKKTRSAAIRFERYADSIYRKRQFKALQNHRRILQHQHNDLETLGSRLTAIEKALDVTERTSLPKSPQEHPALNPSEAIGFRSD
ncbi:MAG: hypothetical protein Q9221_001732 [Calogaya cf. arnoldii]